MAVAPLDKVARVLDYATEVIPQNRIWLGTPNYAYDFTLPYESGVSMARALSNVNAITQALEVGANIEYDPIAQAPFYRYYDASGKEHIVWFQDARSVADTLELMGENDISGLSVWTVMRYFPQLWQVIASNYKIKEANLSNPLEDFT